MQKSLFLLLTFVLFCCVRAYPGYYAFRISFTDKHSSSFSLEHPGKFLSEWSLERRAKYGIAVDSSDFPVSATYLDSVLLLTKGKLHSTSRWQNTCVLLTVDSNNIQALTRLSFIRQVKKVAYYPDELPAPGPGGDNNLAHKPTTFDPSFYGNAWDQIHLCNGEYLHEQGYKGKGVRIAVIDVGFEGIPLISAFDSMRLHNRLLDTWNFINDAPDVFQSGNHGCQVLSCMAGYLPGTYVGTAPEASYALYATDDLYSEQAIEEDNFQAATERADSLGIDLINASVGYNIFDNPEDSYDYSDLDGHSTTVAKAVNTAVRKGMLVVVSAGNEGANSWKYILTPGDADSALTVGSVDKNKLAAASSGQGPNAGGKRKPNIMAMGSPAAVISATGAIAQLSGTSFAAPVISGLTACFLQQFPQKSPMEIIGQLEASAHLYENPDDKNGYGVPDFRKASGGPSGVEHFINGAKHGVALYPNPVTNNFCLDFPSQAGGHTVYLYDCLGRMVFSKKLVRIGEKMDISELPSGIYSLQIEALPLTLKLVKQ